MVLRTVGADFAPGKDLRGGTGANDLLDLSTSHVDSVVDFDQALLVLPHLRRAAGDQVVHRHGAELNLGREAYDQCSTNCSAG